MGDKQRHDFRTPVNGRIADAFLALALVLLIFVSWQGPSANPAGGLKEAAHEAVARQVGAPFKSRIRYESSNPVAQSPRPAAISVVATDTLLTSTATKQ